jgi:predicted ATPase/class 3 adenylate cyclase
MENASNLTFLFTDIEGSTSKWEEQPEQMAQAVGRHDALLRDAVQRHQGHIVKTTGDGIYAAFPTSLAGLLAVVEIQLALLDPATTAGMGLRIRCGLHTGPVQKRDNDYFGGTINRTARIMGAAHGGQILVSKAIADELGGHLPCDVDLKDLGAVRLKGLATSEVVYQVMHPRLFQNFPALRELEATPNNLPQQLTSFVGRERERAEIEEMLTGTRLLTLLGMGGLGKTRLSLAVATSVMDAYPDGVWFIDLQTIRDDPLVASETARVLGVREEPGRPLMQTLCGHLKSRKLMLILDNCEQVIEAAADVANAILRATPDVRIVTTSRIALRVPGEQTFVVQPLPVPKRTADAETLLRSPSVLLFVERAKLHKPSFALTEKEAPAVADLVYRLEGIPLALELAAARVRSLSVADINKRLNDRYKILTGGDRTLQARQQTLRALVDWSYDLLEENEQVLLARLSVFAGGFDVNAIEAICGAEPLLPEDALDIVTSLVEKSLLRAEDGEDGARYRMLETIRDYAREKLVLRDELAAVAAGHCEYFLEIAKASQDALQGPDHAEWTRRNEEALDDYRAAIRTSLQGTADPIVAVKFIVALMGFWMLRGYCTEGRSIVRTALAHQDVKAHDVAHAHALYVGAALADAQGNYAEALEMLGRCLEIRRRNVDSPIDVAATLSTLSLVRLHAGDLENAKQVELEAIDNFRRLGSPVGEAIGLVHLGEIDLTDERFAEAKASLERALEIAVSVKYPEIESECNLMLGQVALAQSEWDESRAKFEQSLEVCQAAQDRKNEAIALWWLGRLDLSIGDYDAARTRLAGALRLFQSFEMFSELLDCLEDHAALLEAEGKHESAARLLAGIDTAHGRLAMPPATRTATNASLIRAIRARTAETPAWAAQGRGWELSQTVQFAQAEVAQPLSMAAAA